MKGSKSGPRVLAVMAALGLLLALFAAGVALLDRQKAEERTAPSVPRP